MTLRLVVYIFAFWLMQVIAQVLQQQETPRQVLLQDLRDMHTGHGEAAGHVDKGRAILLVRGRVHGDEAATVSQADPEIASETGVTGGGGKREIADTAGIPQPLL